MNTVSVPFTVSNGTLSAVKLYKINNLGVRTAITVTGAVSGSNVEFTGISVGEYMVFASYGDGFYKPNSTITITTTTNPTVASSPVDSSYLGGKSLSVTGEGFSVNPSDNLVYVCGEPAKVTASTTTSLTVTIPALPTQLAVEKYKFVRDGPVVGRPIGNEADASAPFDGQD